MIAPFEPRRVLGLAAYGLVIVFGVWCAISLRSDLARMSFVSLWRSWDLILIAVTFSMANYALRSARWQWYLKSLGYRVPLSFSMLTYIAGIAFTLSPGKLGELVRARYYTGMGLPVRDVAAAILVERLIDLFAMVALAALTVAAYPEYQSMIWIAAIVILMSLTCLVAFPWERIARSLTHSTAAIGWKFSTVVAMLVNARCLLGPRSVVCGFLVGLAAWGLEGLGLGVLSGLADPSHIDAIVAVGIYATATLVGAVSFLPGGLGSTEAVMAALLTSRGYAIPDALLITLVCRLATLWLGVSLGWLAIAALRTQLRASSEPL